MTYHFLAECLSTPWAMRPENLNAYSALLAQRYFGAAQATDPQAATQRMGPARSGATAVVGVYGPIMQRASMMNICDGGTSTTAISQALRQANADESISNIVLDIDSPGGSVYGVAELASEIRASAKPVTAVCNSLAASAAYWLGASASEFFITPGGEAGSIGVYMVHENWAKALAEAGVDPTVISAGKFKTEGHPYGPLSDEAKAFMQSRTDDYYAAFTRDVAKGRKVSVDVVRSGMGQGRVLGASQAVSEGMVDGIMTLEQAIRHAQRSSNAPRGRSAQDQSRQQLALLSIT